MMKTPCARAFLITSFMRGAISATRRVAPAHQCWSHMSQITMAVFWGSHWTVRSITCHSFVSGVARIRARVGSDSSDAPPAEASWTNAAGSNIKHENARSSDEFIELDRRQATQGLSDFQFSIFDFRLDKTGNRKSHIGALNPENLV